MSLRVGLPLMMLCVLPAMVSAENIPETSVIKVCGMHAEYDYIIKHKCEDGEEPQIVERKNIGPLSLPATEKQARRAAEQKYELHGLKPGEIDFHDVDRFTLSCEDKIEYLYFDIYHCEH